MKKILSAPKEHCETTHFDIAILGSELSGILLAAILAKAGISVALIETQPHPRIRFNEATIPYISLIFEMIAKRYNLPEIRNITRYHDVMRHIMPSSGVKKNLGFLYHKEGEWPEPHKSIQFNVPSGHDELHLYRQDIDAYLQQVAITHGAVHLPHRPDNEIIFDTDHVKLRDGYGRWITAQYLVDASGRNSPVATQLGLRIDHSQMLSCSTRYAAHMIGVKPFDQVMLHNYPGKWHEGTLHHIFNGGWICIVPFNNTPSSTNPACSVLIHLEGEYPQTDGDKVLHELTNRFPALKPAFSGAQRISEWKIDQPAQYNAVKTRGLRYLLLDEAVCDNDYLFSSKLANTTELVFHLGHRLIEAVAEENYDTIGLKEFAILQNEIFALNDRIINASYTAFRDPLLWNAFVRSWLLFSIACTVTGKRVLNNFVKSNAISAFSQCDNVVNDGIWMPVDKRFRNIFENSLQVCEQARQGKITMSAASETIFTSLKQAVVPPIFDFANPDACVYKLTFLRKLRTLWWGLKQAPDDIGKLIFYRSFRSSARVNVMSSTNHEVQKDS